LSIKKPCKKYDTHDQVLLIFNSILLKLAGGDLRSASYTIL